MNIAELAEKIADKHSLSKADARAVVDMIFDEIATAVASGEEVSLAGIGKFSPKDTAERQGRNPSTGEAMTIKAQRKIAFAPAKAVKDKVNAAKA